MVLQEVLKMVNQRFNFIVMMILIHVAYKSENRLSNGELVIYPILRTNLRKYHQEPGIFVLWSYFDTNNVHGYIKAFTYLHL